MVSFIKNSKSVFPNTLLSKQDFKDQPWKRCMVFVFMARWVYGKDGQKQWRLFDLDDLKFNMRAFEMWKRAEPVIMSHTEEYKALPDTCTDPRKRKRSGRGRLHTGVAKKKGRPRPKLQIADSSSASESPLKRVTFDLTAFSSSEDEGFQLRPPTPPKDNGEDGDASTDGDGEEYDAEEDAADAAEICVSKDD